MDYCPNYNTKVAGMNCRDPATLKSYDGDYPVRSLLFNTAEMCGDSLRLRILERRLEY
jgi:hypothetical protein